MKNPSRVTWLARFDVEPLLSAILMKGMWLSLALLMVSLVSHRTGGEWRETDNCIFAKSLPSLLFVDLHHLGSLESWSRLCLDVAVSVLMLTPYLRVLVTMWYFQWVEPNRSQVLFATFVLAILTVALLTTLV